MCVCVCLSRMANAVVHMWCKELNKDYFYSFGVQSKRRHLINIPTEYHLKRREIVETETNKQKKNNIHLNSSIHLFAVQTK